LELAASDGPAQDYLPASVDTMNLKRALREIQADPRCLHPESSLAENVTQGSILTRFIGHARPLV
jgi:hypothetical protein